MARSAPAKQRNTTTSRSATEANRAVLEFDEAVLNNINEGILTIGSGGSIDSMNAAAARSIGWKLSEIKGRHVGEVLHCKNLGSKPFPMRRGASDVEDVFVRKDGSTFDVVYSASPIGKGRTAAGSVIIFRDVTRRKQTQRDLEFYLSIAERIRVETDAEKLLNDLSKAVGEYLGINRCSFSNVDLEKEVESIASEYIVRGRSSKKSRTLTEQGISRRTASKFLKTYVNRNSKTDPRTAKVFDKFHRPHKELAYLMVPLLRNGKWSASLRCSHHEPREWTENEITLVEAIAERAWSAVERLNSEELLRRSEERYRESEQLLRTVTDNLPALIAFVGADQRFRFVNETYADWYGSDQASIIGRKMSSVIGRKNYNALRPHIDEALAGRSTSFETELESKKLGKRFVSVAYVPAAAAGKKAAGFYSLTNDISALKSSELRLRASEDRMR